MNRQNSNHEPQQNTATRPVFPSRKNPAPIHLVLDSGYLSDVERQLQRSLADQVQDAFLKQPSIGGVISGRRLIALGKRGSGRPSHFPSKKNAFGPHYVVSLPVESRVESMYALELERNPDVWGFRTQAIELTVPGSMSPVFPDFLIIDREGRPHIREVKANKRFLSLKTRLRNERVAAVLQLLGFSYGVVDLSDLPQGAMSANLFWLHKQFSKIPNQVQIEEFMAIQFTVSTYGELRARCAELGQDPSVVPYLLFTGKLQTYWGNRITDDSGVWK